MKTFEIYFNNLNEQTQKEYLEFQGVTDASELNHETCPITIVELADDDESPKQLIKCEFVSDWDENYTVTTHCVYNPVTGEVTPETSDTSPEGTLTREYIILPDGTELDVCTTCHEYVMKPAMVEGIGKQLTDTLECSNPSCESH